MFSNLLLGLLMGLGLGGWAFAKTQRKNGGLTSQSIIVAVIVGAITVLVVSTLMGMIFSDSN